MIKDDKNNRRASSVDSHNKVAKDNSSNNKLTTELNSDLMSLLARKKSGGEDIQQNRKTSVPSPSNKRNQGRRSVILPIGRNSVVSQNKRSWDTSKLTADMFQDKINRIEDLELVIKEIKESLIVFFMELKDCLILDESYDQELKNILYKPLILEAIKANEPNQLIELMKNLVLGALNLKQLFIKIDTKDFMKDFPEDERDYILLYQKLELEHKKSQRREEELKYILEVAKNQLREYEKQNKIIVDQTKKIINDFRIDYQKLLDVLRDRESDLKEFQREIAMKSDKIHFQDEKLMSLYVLEHKIQAIGQNNQKELKKLKATYEKQIQEQTQPEKVAPNLFLLKEEYEKKVRLLEKELNEKESEKTNSRNQRDFTVQSLKAQIEEQSKSLLQKDKELIHIKDRLTDSNKSLINLLQTNESLKKQQELSQTFRLRKQEAKSNNLKEGALSRPNTSFLTPLRYAVRMLKTA